MENIENSRGLIYHFIGQRILEAKMSLEDGENIDIIRLNLINQLSKVDSSEKITNYLRENSWKDSEDINKFDNWYENWRNQNVTQA